ncbi:MAG TPA: PEP-CTERM sorting domain-containing protein [Pseudoduganella sp.]|jgi:hypothetical protein
MQAPIIAAILSAAALLGSGTASAAAANASLTYSNLAFRVVDLMPNDGIAAGFTLTGSSSSILFSVSDANWQLVDTRSSEFPTESAAPTAWATAGKSYQAWSTPTSGSSSIALDAATSQDGSGRTLLTAGWRFDLTAGTALVVTGALETTLGRTPGPSHSELGANTLFEIDGRMDLPGDLDENQWSRWTTEAHTSWAQSGTFTENFGLILVNNGATAAQGRLELFARTDLVGYLGSPPPIPEPSTYMMLGAGLLVAGAAARRRRS